MLIFLLQGLILVLIEDRQDFRIDCVHLGGSENWSFTPEILLQAPFLPKIKDFLYQLDMSVSASDMQD